MLTPLNRRELTTLRSLDDSERIRQALHAQGIEYQVKAKSRTSIGALNMGSRELLGAGSLLNQGSTWYEIYAKKEDWEAWVLPGRQQPPPVFGRGCFVAQTCSPRTCVGRGLAPAPPFTAVRSGPGWR